MREFDHNVVKVDALAPQVQAQALQNAVTYLRAGQAVVFPTDTVYGIGVAVSPDSTPDLLFQIKQRERSLAIPWLVASRDDLFAFGADVPLYCQRMAEELWPGPLTLVVRASSRVPRQFCGADGTIALRMPDSPVALALMDLLQAPMATTSANLHGKGAVNDASLLDPQLTKLVPLVLDGGAVEGGRPSTIVACTGPEPRVLREGAITPQQVQMFM